MDFEICYPGNVTGWEPRNSFKTFQVKENAGEEFVAVNNQVRKCCQDIDGVIQYLKTLRTKMGENTGTTSQIDRIVNSLGEKKQDLITKNQELINACEQVVQYIFENKSNKSAEAARVSETIERIDIYKG